MPAINPKVMKANKILLRMMSSIQRARQTRKVICRTFFPAALTVLFLLLIASFGCAPTSNGDGNQINSVSAAADDLPEITDEKLKQEINNAYLREVPEETGASEPISWRFDEDEPKEFTVVDKQVNGERATIVLDIKTQSAPGTRSPKYLAGQIRTKWELESGWALRVWRIAESENISMKYKNLPKSPATNSEH